MRPGKTRIHRGLVGDRTLVGSRYLSQPDLRREYDSEIAPRTEAALRRILGQVELPLPRRVLDLGAGTGATARVVRSCFGDAVELVAVDKVPGPGILVADVLRGVRPAGVSGCFDLIVAAHLLNELSERLDLEGRARLVAGWCRDLLQPDGTCIVIEPALRDTSRARSTAGGRPSRGGALLLPDAVSGAAARSRLVPRQRRSCGRRPLAGGLQLPDSAPIRHEGN